MSGAHMVCIYGKILTSILRINVYMTSRPACDWVYISLVLRLLGTRLASHVYCLGTWLGLYMCCV